MRQRSHRLTPDAGYQRRRTLKTKSTKSLEHTLRRTKRGDICRAVLDGEVCDVEVWQVDPFRGTLVVKRSGGVQEIAMTQVHTEDAAVDGTTMAKRRGRKRKTSVPVSTIQGDEVGVEEVAVPYQLPLATNSSGKLIQVGHTAVVSAGESTLPIGITTIKKTGNSAVASGCLISGGKVLTDVTISAPTSYMQPEKVKVDKDGSRHLATASKFDFQTLPTNGRREVRKAMLGHVLRKEVKSSFAQKSFAKTFCVGIVCLEFDSGIFGLIDNKREYSYQNQNLDTLDTILGAEWDVQKATDSCRFVTKLVLKVKDMQLYGRVWTATHRAVLPDNYRIVLSRTDLSSSPCNGDDF